MALIPTRFRNWFTQQGWSLLPHQKAMVERYAAGESTLLIAPTGTGKTLSGFLPSLIDIDASGAEGLHTLYISPLKALTYDIERNLMKPIRELGLKVTVESRTGDTSAHRRKRQRAKPPHILLITPESLMLMLSYADAPAIFRHVRSVIVDEIHHFAPGKRGDLTTLALAQLSALAPRHRRIGLSATVSDPETLRHWLGPVANRPTCYSPRPENGRKYACSVLSTVFPIMGSWRNMRWAISCAKSQQRAPASCS